VVLQSGGSRMNRFASQFVQLRIPQVKQPPRWNPAVLISLASLKIGSVIYGDELGLSLSEKARKK